MLCPVLHNWLRVAGAVFLVLEITEVAEITDNRGDTETRRMRVAALSAARIAPRFEQPAFCRLPPASFVLH